MLPRLFRQVRVRRSTAATAFGRLDLVIVLGVLAALAVGFAGWKSRAKRVSINTRCAANLGLIGMATAIYSAANDEKLPYAFIQISTRKRSSWDTLIGPLIDQEAGKVAARQLEKSPDRLLNVLRCPADRVPAVTWGTLTPERRTYSMPWHNMYSQNWPPGESNATGIGLWWAPYGRTNSSIDALMKFSNNIPAIRLPMILEPTATLLMTESAQSNNVAFNPSGAAIKHTAAHLATNVIRARDYHGGKIDYLMIDGHVELLQPEQTVGPAGKAGDQPMKHKGMWTIKAGD